MSDAKQTRSPFYRFDFILRELAHRPQPCRVLAEKLEVSSKTVYRDIQYLRDMLAVPVEPFYCSQRPQLMGGFKLTAPVFFCGPEPITPEYPADFGGAGSI